MFGLSDHLKRLSAHGDPLEELGRIIDFEAFRPTLAAALAYGDGAKGGRPPYDPVAMLKVLILAGQNNVSDARMEITGLLMLVFLLFSAFPDELRDLRPIISIATLIFAFIIAGFSYMTSHLIEAERLEEELQRLREQLAKAGAEAAARSYSVLVSAAVERIEELRGEVGARLAAQQPSSRFVRTQATVPAAVAHLTALRSELAREMGGTSGPTAIKQQIAQLLAPGGRGRCR